MRHPDKIGPWVILGWLTQGGMAELFRAQHEGGGPVVCLKRIPPQYLEDDDDRTLVDAFLDEVKWATQLHHPNIVEVFTHGEDGGPYFTMKLVEGPDLKTLLRRGPLPPELVAFIGAEVARALTYIHRSDPSTGRKPLIHSDVTPHNVLLETSGAVMLSDFGLARALRRTGAETITRTRGKDLYLSPEQWRGEPVSAKTDLFSLGLVLWEALTTRHPYAVGRPPSSHLMMNAWVQERTVNNQRSLAVEAAPGAPVELTETIDRLLQFTPDRMATAEELYAALAPLVPYDAHARLARRIAS